MVATRRTALASFGNRWNQEAEAGANLEGTSGAVEPRRECLLFFEEFGLAFKVHLAGSEISDAALSFRFHCSAGWLSLQSLFPLRMASGVSVHAHGGQ